MQGVFTPVGISQIGGGGSSALTPGGFVPFNLINGEGAATIAYGDYCYISGNNTAKLAQSDGTEDEAMCTLMCVQVGGILPGASGKFVNGGVVAGLVGGTANAEIYLSATPGAGQAAPNLTAGQYNTFLALWLSTTSLQFNPAQPILN